MEQRMRGPCDATLNILPRLNSRCGQTSEIFILGFDLHTYRRDHVISIICDDHHLLLCDTVAGREVVHPVHRYLAAFALHPVSLHCLCVVEITARAARCVVRQITLRVSTDSTHILQKKNKVGKKANKLAWTAWRFLLVQKYTYQRKIVSTCARLRRERRRQEVEWVCLIPNSCGWVQARSAAPKDYESHHTS